MQQDSYLQAIHQLERLLQTVQRPEVAQYLRNARGDNNVLDKDAYESAKSEHARLESRIYELEQMLLWGTQSMRRSPHDEVSLGSTVRLVSGGNESHYTLVGAFEADPKSNHISTESLVGRALLGHKIGDHVIVTTPGGDREFTILDIDGQASTSKEQPKEAEPSEAPILPVETLIQEMQLVQDLVGVLNNQLGQLSQVELVTTEHKPQVQSGFILAVRIMEEPLTAQNLTLILSALTELYTKCWLIQQDRLADLIEYAETHDPRFTQEAGLLIHKLTHNSPAEIKFDIGIREIAEAIGIGIDGMIQAPLRREEAKINNQARVLDNQIKQMESQDEHAAKEQDRQLELRQAALDQQEKGLLLEARRLELEAKRLALLEQHLEIEKKRVEYALELATKMSSTLKPNADQQTKEVFARTLLPNLLQLGSSTGLTGLAFPSDENSTTKL